MGEASKWMMLSDIDGTLLYKDGPLSENVIEKANQLMNLGVKLGIATGRAPISTIDIAKSIGTDAPIIVYGGAMIYEYNSAAVLWQSPMSGGTRQLIRDIRDLYTDVCMMVYTDVGIWIYNTNKLILEKGVRQEVDAALDDNNIRGNILKLSLCGPRPSLIEIYTCLFQTSEYKLSFSSKHFAEVVGRNAGKGNAMKELSRLTGIPLSRIIVMGDGENDIEMFEYAGASFAVGNRLKKLNNVADYILPDCSNDGGAIGFEKAQKVVKSWRKL